MHKSKNVIIILLIFIGSISVNAQDKLENLGLLSELVYQKSSIENFAIRVLNDTLVNEDKKKQFITLYNNYKLLNDQFVLQMISSIQSKNSIRSFKKIDNLLYELKVNELSEDKLKRKIEKSFIKSLLKISRFHLNAINFDFSETANSNINTLGLKGFFPSTASLEEITGVLSFVSSTVKNIREAKQNKVEKISLLLDAVRIKPIQEIIKAPKEKKEK